MDLKQTKFKLHEAGRIIRCRLTDHLEDALAARPKVDDDAKDEELFRPFAHAYIIDTMTFEYTSLYREIGRMIAEIVAEYEEEHGVTVDKTQLLLALSVLRLQQNDEEGFLLYFERAQMESQRKSGQALAIDTMVSELSNNLDIVMTHIQESFAALPQVAIVRCSETNATHITAMCYYGSYMIRNQVLHSHDFTSTLFSRNGLLLDGIGLLCAAVWFAAQKQEMQ